MRLHPTHLFLFSLLLLACENTRLTQYKVQGEKLYAQRCATCHQKNGEGFRDLYPPIFPSDFIDQHFNETVCAIEQGIAHEITVNQKKYHSPMKAVKLTDLELAELLTYLYNHGERARGIVTVDEVKQARAACEKQSFK